MKVREITESREQLNEVAPLLVWAAIATIGAVSAYYSYQDLETAYENWYRGTDENGEEYTDADFATDVGGEIADVLISMTLAGTGYKAYKISSKTLRNIWKRGKAVADDVPMPANFPARLQNITMKNWIMLSVAIGTAGHAPGYIWGILEDYWSGKLTKTDMAMQIGAQLLLALSACALVKVGSYAATVSKPVFMNAWNYAVSLGKVTKGVTETATATGASSIASVSGNLGPMQSRNMYNADGTMKNGLEFDNLLGGGQKPKKKKKTRKNA